MTSTVRGGPKVVEAERDDEGHRTYTVTHQVFQTKADTWGPASAMNASGLPAVGSYWLFTRPSSGTDTDVWAFCTPYMKVKAKSEIKEGHPVHWWEIEQKFTTRPMSRCNTETIQNPLLEPDRVGGSWIKYQIEAKRDRFGELLKTPSHEMLKGPPVEFDANRHSVRIEQNTANLELSLISSMANHVNDEPLWGLPARCIKLSEFSWERKLYGVCNFYFTRSFGFDCDSNTFDRDEPAEGTKVQAGDWRDEDGGTSTASDAWQLRYINGDIPDPSNPTHFTRYKDRNGENARTLLTATGLPANVSVIPGTGNSSFGTGSGDVYMIHIEYYPEANFLLLGIPTSFIGLGTGTSNP